LATKVENCVEMKEIYKTFLLNQTKALKGANLCVKKGAIHTLLGENGAGKTTLMRILCGLEKMDSGRIFVNGRHVIIRNQHDALNHGIAMVHQNLSLIEDFTALENIVLQRTPLKFGVFVDLDQARKKIERLMENSGIFVDLDRKVAGLSVAERQKVEILRVLYLEAEILIFDEPTSYLNEIESDQFLRTIRKLRDSGKTVIFITHNAQDALSVSDQITVLRNGTTVYSSEDNNPSLAELTKMMAGETQIFRRQNVHESGKNLISIENVVLREKKRVIGPVSFEIREGEILGIAGFDSSGAVELMEILAGTRRPSDGKIIFLKKDITFQSISERRKIGIGYIPQKKIQVGLSTKLSVAYNLIVNNYKKFSRAGWLNHRKIEEWSNQLAREYEIKISSVWQPADTLSGGNMHRVVIVRELKSKPKLLIACNPTAGLDMKSTDFVHRSFLELCNQGSSILIYSNDLDEILKICDRILVMSKGRLVREFKNTYTLTKDRLIEAMLVHESKPALA